MWLRSAAIPPDQAQWGAFAEIREQNVLVLRQICEEAAAAEAPPGSATRMVGDFYASGMDEAAIERAGFGSLKDELERVASLRTPEALPGLLASLHRSQVAAPFRFAVMPDAKDSARYLAQLQQGGLGLPDRDYYLREDDKSARLRESYAGHLRRMFALGGDSEGTAAANADLIVRLETRLASASMTRVDQRDPYKVYNKRAAAALLDAAPGFAWDRYLVAFAGPQVDDVNLRQPAFFAEMSTMARDIGAEEWRVYLRWHLIREAAPYLGRALVDEHFAFYGRELTGAQELKPRWRRVVETVDGSIGEALGRLYVERAFPPEAKRRVLEMVEDLRSALVERIRALEWMGPATKQRALEKLAKFRVKMGYPDRWRDYSGLVIDRRSYAANVMRAAAFEFDRRLRRLHQPVDRDEWNMSPPTVNAYYHPGYNEIVFPAGILRPPFFDFNADDAVNYGGIGMVIGHEMTHGFDDQGSKFDADGNLREWWSPDDRSAYEARTDLMVKQFESYEALPGLRLNGRLTLGENIADLGGIKVAHAAFLRSLTRATAPASRDGFTPRQRFFLGFAQSWRSLTREEQTRLRVYTDPHSPPEFRVRGPLSNLAEFHEAFGCASGSPMWRPPDARPSIW